MSFFLSFLCLKWDGDVVREMWGMGGRSMRGRSMRGRSMRGRSIRGNIDVDDGL